MSTHTIDIATSNLRDVRKALAAGGSKIATEQTTPGAVGYTTITISSAAKFYRLAAIHFAKAAEGGDRASYYATLAEGELERARIAEAGGR